MGDLFAIIDNGGAASQVAPLVVVEHPGPPRGKGRPRLRIVTPRPGTKSWNNGKRIPFSIVYTDDKTKAYELALKKRANIAMGTKPPFKGPLGIRIFIMLPIPKSWPAHKRDAALAGTLLPTCKPDHDNVVKMLDAFNETVWDDDTQVVRCLCVREYAESPGLIVEVYRLP